jgi:thiamine biosynthesis lipoprotein
MKRIYIPLILLMLLLFVSCKPEEPLVKQDFALATVVKITLRDHATEELMDQLFARLREIEERMSMVKKESDVYKLNHAQGEALQVHEDTYYVIQKAKEYFELTGGYFDPTLGSVVELWKIGTEEAAIPSSEELEKALTHVDGRQIELLDNLQVRIPQGAVLDLGAIAKGYAADEMAKIAKEEGVTSAIFDLGGNVLTLGDKEGKKFRIGIQEPFSEILRGSPFAILLLSNQTVVTSGDYERFFEEDGKRYHHILDFRTGYPVENELASVSIITDSSIRADALSTAVYAMGREKGKAFIESQENLEAIFVTRNKKVSVTTGLSESFILEDSSYHQE